MINIMISKFKEQFRGVCYYLLGLILYSWMLIGLFPTISKLKDTVASQYPEQLMKFFGGNGTLALTTIEGFLAIEYLSLFFVLIVAFYIGSSAGSVIADGVEKKTIDFDLSNPISRTKFLLSGTFTGLIYTALTTILTSLSLWLFCLSYKININEAGTIAFTIIAILFLWAIYGIAIFFSSFLKTKLSVAATTLMIVMGFYLFSSMTRIVDKLANYDKYSLFYLYDPQKLLTNGTININHAIILVLIFLLGLSGALIIFNRRDI